AAQLQAVGQRVAVDNLADGIGQRRDLPYAGGHGGDAVLVEREAIEQRVGQAVGLTGLQITRVGLEDLLGAVDQGGGDRRERVVLDPGPERGQPARGAL